MSLVASHPSHCIVSVLTPPGRAAVATVVVEGENAAEIVAQFFRPAGLMELPQAPIGRILYGQWSGNSDRSANATGEGVVVCRTTPDRVEIHCHGGKAAVQAIVDRLIGAGCQEMDWREWTLATASDPLAAEARVALAEARTRRAAAILLQQFRGALRSAIEKVIASLVAGEREEATRRLDELSDYAPLGLHLTTPWKIVLAGRPNVGKSSLVNALVGYRRSIVHDTPGVTRDVLTASTALDGWPVELADTAGVRESLDALEAAGVARTLEELQKADVVVLVSDVTAPWSADDAKLLAAAPQAVLVHNKCDLLAAPFDDRPAGIPTSAVTGEGLDALKQALVTCIAPQVPPADAAVPFTPRQAEAVREARTLAAQGRAAEAAEQLRDLVGRESNAK